MSDEQGIFGHRLIVSEAIPEGTLILLNRRYSPSGEMDMEATAKASVVIHNIGRETTHDDK